MEWPFRLTRSMTDKRMFAWHWITRLVPVVPLLWCISCTDDPVSYVPLGPPAPDSSRSGPPIFSSVTVTEVGGATAFVSASVRPNGLKTTYWFDYGTSASYGQITRGGVLDSAATLVDIRDTLGSLLPDTLYHFRLVASNSAGQTASMDYSFRSPGYVSLDFPLSPGTEWEYAYWHYGYYPPIGYGDSVKGSQRWRILSSASGIPPLTIDVRVSRVDTTHYWTLGIHRFDTTYVTQIDTTFSISVTADYMIVRWPTLMKSVGYDSLFYSRIPREILQGSDTLTLPRYKNRASYIRGLGLVIWHFENSTNSYYRESLQLLSISKPGAGFVQQVVPRIR
jgi:hypothetical protein